MKKGRIIAAVVVVVVVAAIIGGYLVSRSNARTGITAAQASTQTLRIVVNAPGTLEPSSTRAVFAPVAGTLATVMVHDGDRVTKGQKLATLDAAPLQLARAQAEAQLAAARAMPTGTDRLNRARSRAIDAAEQALKVARANADHATLRAGGAGIVTFNTLAITKVDGSGPTAAPGVSVTPGSPIFTVTDPARLRFNVQVDEADIAGVKTKQSVRITLDAFPGKTFAGKVDQIRQQAVTTSTGGTAFPVLVSVDAGKSRLFSGMTGDADIATSTVPDALVVPVSAVITDGGARFVYRVDGDVVRRTQVGVGRSTDTLTQITSGLAAGDTVATSQVTALSDGAKVDVQS